MQLALQVQGDQQTLMQTLDVCAKQDVINSILKFVELAIILVQSVRARLVVPIVTR